MSGRRLPRGWFGLLGLFACWLLAAGLATAAEPAFELRGEWRLAGSDEPAWHSFDPQRLTRIVRQPAGAEIRLWPARGQWPTGPMLLVVAKPTLERLQWLPPDGAAPVRADLLQADRVGWYGHGRIGFELRPPPRPGEPLRLFVEPQDGINGTLAFALQSPVAFLAADARWLALVTGCLALLAGMALIATVFGLRLRDPTFLYYAGYILSYAMIQVIQTGYVGSLLGWDWVTAAPRAWGRLAVLASVVLAVLFLQRFGALATYLPRSARLLRLYAWAIAINALLGFVPLAPLQALSRALLNPLLILGGPLLLAISVLAWRRGSRYAGVFAIGWTPLLLLTVLGSLQMYGVLAEWTGSNEAALVAAAFEALVLTAGLADRAATVRRDRDIARELADTDPLTGALNRRAIADRLAALDAQGPVAPLAVLFCDLDRFKHLNDTLGHAEGDRALRTVADTLRSELRPEHLLGRFGGEEFILLLPGVDLDSARTVAERLRERIAAVGYPPRFGPLPLTISIGLTVRADRESLEAALSRADAAVYAAKRAGRNCVRIAGVDPAPGAAADERLPATG